MQIRGPCLSLTNTKYKGQNLNCRANLTLLFEKLDVMSSTRNAVLVGILANCVVTIFGYTTTPPPPPPPVQQQRRNVLTNFMNQVPKTEVPFDMSGPSISQLTQAHFEPMLKVAGKNVDPADPAYNQVHQNQHPNSLYEPDPAASNAVYQKEMAMGNMVDPQYQPEMNMGQFEQNVAGQLRGGNNVIDPQYPPEVNPGGNVMEQQGTPPYPAPNAVEPQYPQGMNQQYPQEPPMQAGNSQMNQQYPQEPPMQAGNSQMNQQYPQEPPMQAGNSQMNQQYPQEPHMQAGNSQMNQQYPQEPPMQAGNSQMNQQYPQEPPMQGNGGIPVDPTNPPDIVTPGYQPDPLGQQVDIIQNAQGANVMPEVPVTMQEPPNNPPSVVRSVVHSEPPASPFQVKLKVSSFPQEPPVNPFDPTGQQPTDPTLISEVNPAGPEIRGPAPAYPGTNAEPGMRIPNAVGSLSSGGAVSPAVGGAVSPAVGGAGIIDPVPTPGPEPLPVSTIRPKPLTKAEKRRLKKLQRKREREARKQKKLAARKAKKLKEQQRRLAKQRAKKLKEQQRRLARQKGQKRSRMRNNRRSRSRNTQPTQV
ncbi:bromodomain-containing protein 4-like [Saccostrea cucullata]|uniref:bromodomain-containing protein 4-like n=1 Tax=Saccostrea cuccullata TaxID=36930 RepID=UPI002ED42B08